MPSSLSLGHVQRGAWHVVDRVDGERSFRRRLLEMGILPGTRVKVLGAAPLGDPITIDTDDGHGCGGRLSIRKREADAIWVTT